MKIIPGRPAFLYFDRSQYHQRSTIISWFHSPQKCEIISDLSPSAGAQLSDITCVQPNQFTILGDPLTTDAALDSMLDSALAKLKLSVDRLYMLSYHDALLLVTLSRRTKTPYFENYFLITYYVLQFSDM